ncbi:nitroreductase family deazaflavin-dependent oxidoreductase [Aquihabitans sp. McL0605]|uniref:nitroreductase family deazaflavin-dependent oxidoreductase n=1 Tax=Aquihabitans sp. McL0605 TaxID=3415671 RepID=UPI003CFB2C49
MIATDAPSPADARYLAPSKGDLIFNRIARRLTAMGLSLKGSRELRIVGRKSGEVRTNVVNLLTLDGERYLVAPRGTTEWVRNLRAAGGGELKVGRKVEAFRAEEVADADKPAILHEYLVRWAFEVGRFFEGIDADSTDEELAAAASGFPAFRLVPAA